MIDEKIKAEAERRYPRLQFPKDASKRIKADILIQNAANEVQRSQFIAQHQWLIDAGANFGKEMGWVKYDMGDENLKAGTWYLVINAKGDIWNDRWENRWEWVHHNPLTDPPVTHWMPLPLEPGGE